MSTLDKKVLELREATFEYEKGDKESALYKIANLANLIMFMAMELLFGEKEAKNEKH